MANEAPRPGDLAPDFRLPSTEGRDITLSEHRGRVVVLYFYPRDMTPGCTTEACDFRDRYDALRAAGAVLLGVSPDPVTVHQRFAGKHALPFPLLADEAHAAQTAYGVRKEKNMYGRTVLGVERSTFLIDPDGILRRAWRKVKVAGHAEEVLEAVRASA